MPTFEFECEECEYQWEDIVFSHEPLPTICEHCKTEGKVKKIMSIPATGIVELTGHDLKTKIKSDAKKLTQGAAKNENTLANLVGENRYQGNLSMQKKIKDM